MREAEDFFQNAKIFAKAVGLYYGDSNPTIIKDENSVSVGLTIIPWDDGNPSPFDPFTKYSVVKLAGYEMLFVFRDCRLFYSAKSWDEVFEKCDIKIGKFREYGEVK